MFVSSGVYNEGSVANSSAQKLEIRVRSRNTYFSVDVDFKKKLYIMICSKQLIKLKELDDGIQFYSQSINFQNNLKISTKKERVRYQI